MGDERLSLLVNVGLSSLAPEVQKSASWLRASNLCSPPSLIRKHRRVWEVEPEPSPQDTQVCPDLPSAKPVGPIRPVCGFANPGEMAASLHWFRYPVLGSLFGAPLQRNNAWLCRAQTPGFTLKLCGSLCRAQVRRKEGIECTLHSARPGQACLLPHAGHDADPQGGHSDFS